jgi:hypothetical protein
MNRLKAYVRRTILEAERGYRDGKRRTPESLRSTFIDATRGTDTGWWSDLIYTAPMLEMAHRYRRDIAATFRDYMEQTGEGYGASVGRPEDHLSVGLCIDATSEGIDWNRYNASANAPVDRSSREDLLCDAKLFGLRFAVEWLTQEVARDLDVGL